MLKRFYNSLLTVGILMQICHHFPAQSNALRMINLDAPQFALEGDTIQLSCAYSLVMPSAHSLETGGGKLTGKSQVPDRSLEIETVYAVKWYRDESEFFRYLSRDWPHKQQFAVDGLNIDVEKSDNQTVVLRNVSLTTSGLFRCEVSTDAPSFLTESIERRLLIHHLPNEGPFLEYLNPSASRKHYLGAELNFRCRTKESKPAAMIDWIINDTLNLTALDKMPSDINGKPLMHSLTHRLVSLPLSRRGVKATTVSVPRGGTANKFVYLIQSSQVQSPKTSTRSAPGQSMLTAHALEDLDRVASGGLGTNAIPLTADSLDQLLESSISWLNLTLDSNLLQYLSRASGSTHRTVPLDVRWSERRTVSASSNFLASLNHTSRGNSRAKTKGQIGPINGLHQSDAPSTGQRSVRLSLRVRCVARVMHLSLSDDVRIHLVNKTQEQVESEAAEQSIRRANALQQSNIGASHSPAFIMQVIYLSVSVLLIRKALVINGYYQDPD